MSDYIVKVHTVGMKYQSLNGEINAIENASLSVIRTLATNPQILLLDEAFSALDYQTRLAVTEDIYAIIKRENKTAVLVTHDIAESISMADRVVVLSKRPATIKDIYDIELSCENRTPLSSREAPEFRYYFNKIWKKLDVHV